MGIESDGWESYGSYVRRWQNGALSAKEKKYPVGKGEKKLETDGQRRKGTKSAASEKAQKNLFCATGKNRPYKTLLAHIRCLAPPSCEGRERLLTQERRGKFKTETHKALKSQLLPGPPNKRLKDKRNMVKTNRGGSGCAERDDPGEGKKESTRDQKDGKNQGNRRRAKKPGGSQGKTKGKSRGNGKSVNSKMALQPNQ